MSSPDDRHPPFAKVFATAPDHYKIQRLAHLLEIDETLAFGALCRLWVWLPEHASNGRLKQSAEEISVIMGLIKSGVDPNQLVDALVEVRLLDREDDTLVVHDWTDNLHTGAFYVQRSQQGIFGNHIRHHKNRGISDPTCESCVAEKEESHTATADSDGAGDSPDRETDPEEDRILRSHTGIADPRPKTQDLRPKTEDVVDEQTVDKKLNNNLPLDAKTGEQTIDWFFERIPDTVDELLDKAKADPKVFYPEPYVEKILNRSYMDEALQSVDQPSEQGSDPPGVEDESTPIGGGDDAIPETEPGDASSSDSGRRPLPQYYHHQACGVAWRFQSPEQNQCPQCDNDHEPRITRELEVLETLTILGPPEDQLEYPDAKEHCEECSPYPDKHLPPWWGHRGDCPKSPQYDVDEAPF